MRWAVLLICVSFSCLSFSQAVTNAVPNGKMFADAIQDQILAPMCKENYYLNLDRDAFAKIKPLVAHLKTVQLQEDEKVFLVYIERYVKAGEEEAEADDLYKGLALEMIAPLVVKIERRNVKLPEEKVAVFKKWFYDDAMESKLIELRDRYWNMKKTKKEALETLKRAPKGASRDIPPKSGAY